MQIQSYFNIKQNPEANFWFGFVAVNVLTLGYIFGFLNPGDIDTDGGTFAAIAMKHLDGGKLYLDAWDHKPPGIYYLIELFFIIITDKIMALYCLAVIGILALVNGLYTVVHNLVESLWCSLLITALFILTGVNSLYLGDGLYTEIFGAVFIIWSLSCYSTFEKARRDPYAYVAAFLSGIAFWFKEPFIFLSIPIFVFLAINLRQWTKILKLCLAFIAPSLIFLTVLWGDGSLSGFIDMIFYNFTYSGNDENIIPNSEQLTTLWDNILNPLLLMTGLIVLFAIRSLRKTLPKTSLMFNFSLMTGGLFFILISPYNFNHYYLPFIVILFYCFASFLNFEKRHFKSSRIIVYICLLYTINHLDGSTSSVFRKDFKSYKPDRIAQRLKEDKSKTLFIDLVNASGYYVKGDKIFTTFLAVPVHYHFNESRQGLINRKRIFLELTTNKPMFLITNETTSYMYWQMPEPHFYESNYAIIDSMTTNTGQRVFLWKLKQ